MCTQKRQWPRRISILCTLAATAACVRTHQTLPTGKYRCQTWHLLWSLTQANFRWLSLQLLRPMLTCTQFSSSPCQLSQLVPSSLKLRQDLQNNLNALTKRHGSFLGTADTVTNAITQAQIAAIAAIMRNTTLSASEKQRRAQALRSGQMLDEDFMYSKVAALSAAHVTWLLDKPPLPSDSHGLTMWPRYTNSECILLPLPPYQDDPDDEWQACAVESASAADRTVKHDTLDSHLLQFRSNSSYRIVR